MRHRLWLAPLLVLVALALTVVLPSAAFATTTTVPCSGGGSFDIDDSTHVVANGTSCIGTADIPSGVTEIGTGAFQYAPLTGVTVPSSVTAIDAYAFYYATITSVTFSPESHLATIGTEAFANTLLTTITIPSSVTTLGNWVFHETVGFTSVYFLGNAPTFFGQDDPFYNIVATAYRFSNATGFGTDPIWPPFPPGAGTPLTLAYWLPTPAAPVATAGEGSATVAVALPTSGPPPTSFRISVVGDSSKFCTVTGSSGSCTISGLTPGTSYTFIATSTDGFATSAASAASNAVTPTAAAVAQAAPAVVGNLAVRTVCAHRVCTSTGVVPAGATSVTQIATRGTSRSTAVCAIAKTGSKQRFTCVLRLTAGRWKVVTAARNGTVVVARSTQFVRIHAAVVVPRPLVPSAVTG